MLKNAEIQALILAVGAGVAEDFDLAKIRYHKVIRRRRDGKVAVPPRSSDDAVLSDRLESNVTYS